MTSPYQMDTVLPSKVKHKNDNWTKFRFKWGKQIAAFLFLLPAIVLFATFAWYPIARSVEMSFQNVSLAGESTWVGFDNYSLMLKDPVFEIAWRNSLQFAVWSLVLGFLVPVVLAILIREMRIGQGFFRVVYFLPTVVPMAVAVIIWRFIYDPDAGYLNAFLGVFGIEGQNWLQNALLVKPSLIAVMTWSGFGTTALIYLASLQEVATELYDAAELDGAKPMQRIQHITLPHLYPIMSLMFILQVIAVVQVFTEPFLLTNGGPGRETLTPAMHIYNRAFIRFDLGYASAWSVVMIVILVSFSIIYQIINRRLSDN